MARRVGEGGREAGRGREGMREGERDWRWVGKEARRIGELEEGETWSKYIICRFIHHWNRLGFTNQRFDITTTEWDALQNKQTNKQHPPEPDIGPSCAVETPWNATTERRTDLFWKAEIQPTSCVFTLLGEPLLRALTWGPFSSSLYS